LRLPCDLGALVEAVSLAFERAGLTQSTNREAPGGGATHAPFGDPGSLMD
jgi:hypothetical protein